MADIPKSKELLARIKGNAAATQIIAEFLRERLFEKQGAFTQQTRDTFEVHKGRCLELKDILEELTK